MVVDRWRDYFVLVLGMLALLGACFYIDVIYCQIGL
jgi:hypothetical protein